MNRILTITIGAMTVKYVPELIESVSVGKVSSAGLKLDDGLLAAIKDLRKSENIGKSIVLDVAELAADHKLATRTNPLDASVPAMLSAGYGVITRAANRAVEDASRSRSIEAKIVELPIATIDVPVTDSDGNPVMVDKVTQVESHKVRRVRFGFIALAEPKMRLK